MCSCIYLLQNTALGHFKNIFNLQMTGVKRFEGRRGISAVNPCNHQIFRVLFLVGYSVVLQKPGSQSSTDKINLAVITAAV